jgi:C4-dicarboxylate-specific signal transduction histidine kinase
MQLPDARLQARAALDRIVRDGARANEIVRRIRTLLKKADTNMAPLKLNEVLGEALSFVRHELINSRVALRVEHASALPVILADKVQLQQVILNLVMNGIEAMQSVTDCGVGFSADGASLVTPPRPV